MFSLDESRRCFFFPGLKVMKSQGSHGSFCTSKEISICTSRNNTNPLTTRIAEATTRRRGNAKRTTTRWRDASRWWAIVAYAFGGRAILVRCCPTKHNNGLVDLVEFAMVALFLGFSSHSGSGLRK
ncbi:hypothetical protein DEO72_LG3g886 [Vigna unguiculata]|uniref:Uncharacterized protein n=1 Tax=Vigna unguiculata TaxID=3917 RepID=A0A4D6LDF1_VIGUN|nr:hypothetical protein DEO72_LG3g886 [Vigna unguiculata]